MRSILIFLTNIIIIILIKFNIVLLAIFIFIFSLKGLGTLYILQIA